MNEIPPIPPRKRLQELLAIPERQRTDEQWDELNELEIKLASANREDAPDPNLRRGIGVASMNNNAGNINHGRRNKRPGGGGGGGGGGQQQQGKKQQRKFHKKPGPSSGQ